MRIAARSVGDGASKRTDNRCYYIFRQTMGTRKAGNMTVTREDLDNLFELSGTAFTSPGRAASTRRLTRRMLRSGAPFDITGHTAQPPVRAVRRTQGHGLHNHHDELKRETATLDRFLTYYEVPTTGDWFNKGKSWYRPIECPWLDAHLNQNQGSSTS